MKELSIEQKAKAYDEAVERARKIHNDTEFDYEKGMVEEIFPELAMSEDEKIRKELISFLQSYDTLLTQKFIAWLEKQNGQKIALPKWKYKKDHTPLLRDSIILNKYGCVAKLSSGAIVSDVWVLDYNELAKLPKEELEKQGEQETLCDKCKQQQPSHSCQDITALGRCAVEHEQKPVEWSEEEKCNVDIIVSRLEVDIEYWKSRSKRRIDEDKRVIDWLKSLRPQNTWKPSEEQMDALNHARWNAPFNIEILDSLYNDLKKLTE